MNLQKIKKIRREYGLTTSPGNIFLRFLDAVLEKENEAEAPKEDLTGWTILGDFLTANPLMKALNFSRARFSRLVSMFPSEFKSSVKKVKGIGNGRGIRYFVLENDFIQVFLECEVRGNAEKTIIEKYKKERKRG